MKIIVDMLLAALLGAFIVCAIEGYLILGEVRRHTAHARQTLAVTNDLLAQMPGKSAPRTEAPADVQPRRWWQLLRNLTVEVEPEPDEPLEVLDIDTAEAPAVDVIGGLRTTRPTPQPRAHEDEWRERFTFNQDGRRA